MLLMLAGFRADFLLEPSSLCPLLLCFFFSADSVRGDVRRIVSLGLLVCLFLGAMVFKNAPNQDYGYGMLFHKKELSPSYIFARL
jgi:hypothetical protein